MYLSFYRYLPKSIGGLYVGSGKRQSYMAEIKLNHTLRQLHNKIIECSWDYDKECWSFMRERTDKSFPNAYATAKGEKFQILCYDVKKYSQSYHSSEIRGLHST